MPSKSNNSIQLKPRVEIYESNGSIEAISVLLVDTIYNELIMDDFIHYKKEETFNPDYSPLTIKCRTNNQARVLFDTLAEILD